MTIEMPGFERMLNHIIVQNAHNTARLNALMNVTSVLLAELNGTEPAEEYAKMMENVNKEIPGHLADAIDAINDVPDIS